MKASNLPKTHQNYPPRSSGSGDPHSTKNLSIHAMNLEVLVLGREKNSKTTIIEYSQKNRQLFFALSENQRKLGLLKFNLRS